MVDNPTHCIQHLKGQYQKVQYLKHPHPKLSRKLGNTLKTQHQNRQPLAPQKTMKMRINNHTSKKRHTSIRQSNHERAMRPDSPTHEQGLQEGQKSDQQDEIRIEQRLADDQDTNLSKGPMPPSDFTAPEEPHTDPNRYIQKKPPPN
eukprot:g72447.t1